MFTLSAITQKIKLPKKETYKKDQHGNIIHTYDGGISNLKAIKSKNDNVNHMVKANKKILKNSTILMVLCLIVIAFGFIQHAAFTILTSGKTVAIMGVVLTILQMGTSIMEYYYDTHPRFNKVSIQVITNITIYLLVLIDLCWIGTFVY